MECTLGLLHDITRFTKVIRQFPSQEEIIFNDQHDRRLAIADTVRHTLSLIGQLSLVRLTIGNWAAKTITVGKLYSSRTDVYEPWEIVLWW
jgi:hypothetical protein